MATPNLSYREILMADVDPRWNTAAAASLSAWGILQTSIHLVSHSENLGYRIETDNGTYGLRVHRPGYHTRQELISEQQWIAALANSGCSVPTPQPTLTGDGLATVNISGEAPRSASLVRWVNGDLLGSRLENAPRADRLDLIREIGATNARLHAAASAWKVPAGFRRIHWDADGLMGDDPVWGRFWEVPGLSANQRDLLLRTRDRCKERLDGLVIAPEHYGLIHADMHPYNMIWSDAGIHVIDFDDAGFGWQAYDVAVALYNYRRDTEFDSIRVAFIDGYQSVRPISDSTRENLCFFFVVRSLVWLGWINDRPDLFSSKRLVQAVDLVCGEAEAYSQHP
jgi:Ser/Thr protein kinase RdoA (MazF antagonist)